MRFIETDTEGPSGPDDLPLALPTPQTVLVAQTVEVEPEQKSRAARALKIVNRLLVSRGLTSKFFNELPLSCVKAMLKALFEHGSIGMECVLYGRGTDVPATWTLNTQKVAIFT